MERVAAAATGTMRARNGLDHSGGKQQQQQQQQLAMVITPPSSPLASNSTPVEEGPDPWLIVGKEGGINFQQFEDLYNAGKIASSQEAMLATFRCADTDGDGIVSYKDARRFIEIGFTHAGERKIARSRLERIWNRLVAAGEKGGGGGAEEGRNDHDSKLKLEGAEDGTTTVLEVNPDAGDHDSSSSSSSGRTRRRGGNATKTKRQKEQMQQKRGISFVEWMLAMQEVDVPLVLSQFIPRQAVGITIAYTGIAVVLSRLHYTDD
mmetsp:Transcript_27542/g.38456  ORF Transcript_27542/g.38456 Transcript_27542/m.38456 type:complete len:264 (+) Transcript_27542:148-939(+)